MSQEFIQPRQDSLKCIFIKDNEISSGTRRLQLFFLFILKGRNQAELTDKPTVVDCLQQEMSTCCIFLKDK